jgi:lysophospholipase L1-like esterase
LRSHRDFVYRTWSRVAALFLAIATFCTCSAEPAVEFPFKDGDRVDWIGSSSTHIGIWCKTIEFLLRTRHPEIHLTFTRHTTGGGTFDTGNQNLTKWLAESKPTFVLYNYGGNDAGGGEKGLPKFFENMDKAVETAKAAGARVIVMTHQSGDVRKTGKPGFDNRKLYAEEMIKHCIEKGTPVIDTHHALEKMQLEEQKVNDAYTINRDTIHLTESAYIGWGYFLYEKFHAPAAESLAEVSASGQAGNCVRCKVNDIKHENGVLTFTRADEILPLLPPAPAPGPTKPPKTADGTQPDPVPAAAHEKSLPPRKLVPLEKYSSYMLKVTGLADGTYAISCEGKPVGSADAAALAAGVNLNSLLFDSKNDSPWAELAKELWSGKSLEKIGKTAWVFEVRKK